MARPLAKRAAKRSRPSAPQELHKRVTRLERLLAELVIAVTGMNEGAVREFQWMQDTFTQHEMDIRNSFADTNELVNRLNDRIVELHQTVLTRLDLLMTALDETRS
jgi:hypothetical protein